MQERLSTSSASLVMIYYVYPVRLWFPWISFDYRVPLDFGRIMGGLYHVNHVIRLPIERGISRHCHEKTTPSVVKPEIEGNVNFEIKSRFMRELREDTFFKNKNKDSHDHVDRVLNIALATLWISGGMDDAKVAE
nr:hypothetical protein [Tanacetum cinerariifolium]